MQKWGAIFALFEIFTQTTPITEGKKTKKTKKMSSVIVYKYFFFKPWKTATIIGAIWTKNHFSTLFSLFLPSVIGAFWVKISKNAKMGRDFCIFWNFYSNYAYNRGQKNQKIQKNVLCYSVYFFFFFKPLENGHHYRRNLNKKSLFNTFLTFFSLCYRRTLSKNFKKWQNPPLGGGVKMTKVEGG